jgi:hypothetical protein
MIGPGHSILLGSKGRIQSSLIFQGSFFPSDKNGNVGGRNIFPIIIQRNGREEVMDSEGQNVYYYQTTFIYYPSAAEGNCCSTFDVEINT